MIITVDITPKAMIRGMSRTEVMEFIETLPANEPLPSLDRGGEPVKAVSDPGTSGRVRL